MGLLNLGGGNGSYLKFTPQANAWMLGRDEIPLKMIGFDMASVKTGWGLLAEGQSPDWVFDEVLGRPGPRPSTEHKRGISVRCWLGPQRGFATWSSNGTGPCMGFEAAYEEAVKAGAKAGDMAVFEYTGSAAIKIGKGASRVPNFKFTGVEPMPEGESTETPETKASNTTPPATGSKVAAPPTSNGGGLGFG